MKVAITIRLSDIDYKPYIIIFDIIDNKTSFMLVRQLNNYNLLGDIKYDKDIDYEKFKELNSIDDLKLRIKNIKQDAVMHYLVDLKPQDIFELIEFICKKENTNINDLYYLSHIIGSQTITSV
jgi:hypothetical protein